MENTSQEPCTPNWPSTSSSFYPTQVTLDINHWVNLFSSMIDSKELATKEDLKLINEKVTVMDTENAILRNEMEEIKKRCHENEKHLDGIVNKAKEKNLLFTGLRYSRGTKNYVALIRNFCAKFLNTPEDIKIRVAFPVGDKRKANRPVKAIFANMSDKTFIMKNISLLKGTAYSVTQDYSKSARVKRNNLLVIKKLINKINPDIKTFVNREVLIVEGTRFFWNPDYGIIWQFRDGKEKLSSIVNYDFKPLIDSMIMSESDAIQRLKRAPAKSEHKCNYFQSQLPSSSSTETSSTETSSTETLSMETCN